jgi:hypothetical protein
MREKLNDNPMAQVGLIAVLLIAGVFLLMSLSGGSEEEGEEGASLTPAVASAISAAEIGPGAQPPPLPPPGSGPGAAPPLPRPLIAAFQANRTVALLFVREGGVDDQLTVAAAGQLQGMPGVTPFVVPADQMARYAAIAQGVEVDRVPALVVVRPQRHGSEATTASVRYGFQSPESIVQAVVDARYRGGTLDYHP